MTRIHRRRFAVALLAAIVASTGSWATAFAAPGAFEVWLIDQANTRSDGGGQLVIYDGAAVSGASPRAAAREVIDLGGAAHDLCVDQTGSAPVRPHMLEFDPSGQYGILAYVATGHVLFIEAATRRPVTCIDVGVQAHAAFPAPNGAYVVVANQNGKRLQRITTDFATGTFTLDPNADLDLANGLTPNGHLREDPALRPDNAPICPIVDSSSRLTFVTLRGGGLFVVDSTATPMAIVAEYDRGTIGANGCGGREANGRMYITSGGGTPATPYASDLYACDLSAYPSSAPAQPLPINRPEPETVFRTIQPAVADAHGAVLTKNDRYLWIGDRALNKVTVVETATDRIVNEIDLAGALSDNPTPDLFAVSPTGHRIFAALRGPIPLTGNAPAVNNAVGSTPGLAVIRVTGDGRGGVLQAVLPISNVVDGVERADPHAIAVRSR